MGLIELAIDKITYFLKNNITLINFPEINISSVLELILLTFIIYKIFGWVKNKKAYTLLKGVIFFIMFYAFCYFFNFYTFLWFFDKTMTVLIIALLIVFQPELRKALESIGEKKIIRVQLFGNFISNEKFSDNSLSGIVDAVKVMSKAKTGALILIEQSNSLLEYEKTGIQINADISSQLLINIFEHNTPLHDGALIIKDDKISSATCYLPLSSNMEVDKALGTRHRAALGISEVSDCFVIIVSEETGNVSIAKSGNLLENIDEETLKNQLELAQQRIVEDKKNIFKIKYEEAKKWVKTFLVK